MDDLAWGIVIGCFCLAVGIAHADFARPRKVYRIKTNEFEFEAPNLWDVKELYEYVHGPDTGD